MIQELFYDHIRAMHPLYFTFTKQRVIHPISRETIVSELLSRVYHASSYPEVYGTTMDVLLTNQVKIDEKRWLDLDPYKVQVKQQVFESIWDDVMDELMG